MQEFILEQSDNDIFTAHSGPALIGACVNKHTSLAATLVRTCGNAGRISNMGILMSYLGLLCLGKSDFDAITGRRHDEFFRHALGLEDVPSSEIMRQRMDGKAAPFQKVVNKCSIELLRNVSAKISGFRP